MKKVLFITSRLINPVNSGTKVVLYNYCKGLKEYFDCDIYQFSFYEDEYEKKHKQPDFIKDIVFAEQPGLIEKCWNIIKNSIITKKWPFQVSLFYSKKTKKNLDSYIKKINPDIIIFDLARTAEYAENLDSSKYIKVLEMQDLISKRYIRQAEVTNNSEGAFGAYSKKVPHIIEKIISSKILLKRILKYESKLLSKYEVEISKKFKHIIFVSKNEADQLNKLLNEKKCIDIALGVNYEYFSKNIEVKTKKNLIGFIGNMNISHNKDSVNNFINNILPELLEHNPEIKFRIIGMCSEEYKNRFKGNKYIQITGPVDDLRLYSKECSIIVAPLTYGSGIKTKVLESMAMGIPVVTNSIGAEGIDAINKKEIIICDSNESFVHEINELLNNNNIRNSIGQKGQEFVKKNFIWEKSLTKFGEIIYNNHI